MRTLRVVLAGVLLSAAGVLLSDLLVAPPSTATAAVTARVGRAPLVFTAGLLLWGAIALHTRRTAVVFVPLWTAVCALNGALGVVGAGYTAAEEIPVFLLNVAVPSAVALAVDRARRTRE